MFGESLNDDSDVEYKRGIFVQSVNKLLYNFGSLQRDVLCRLFESHCTSFYSCHLWDLESKNCELMFSAWNKSIRRVWNVPLNTHRTFLPYMIASIHIKEQLLYRHVRMLQAMLRNDNKAVSFIARHATM